MIPPDKQQILRQIAAIPAMERGKLSAYSFDDRPGVSGPYYRLQRWENGKNETRHVPAEEVPAVQAALAGYTQFQQLTGQYADLVIAETRQNIAGSKKLLPSPVFLAQEEEFQQLIARFQSVAPQGNAVAQLELLVRTAVFKSANALVGCVLQQAAECIDAAYQPKPGEVFKGQEPSGCRAFLATSNSGGTTTTTPIRRRAITRPMPRWGWRWVTPRPWPSSCAWKEPTKPPT